MSQYWIYLLPVAAIAYVLWSRRSAPVGDLKAMLARGGQIVDVRSGGEFSWSPASRSWTHRSRCWCAAPAAPAAAWPCPC